MHRQQRHAALGDSADERRHASSWRTALLLHLIRAGADADKRLNIASARARPTHITPPLDETCNEVQQLETRTVATQAHRA
jgi:hypothetical protein